MVSEDIRVYSERLLLLAWAIIWSLRLQKVTWAFFKRETSVFCLGRWSKRSGGAVLCWSGADRRSNWPYQSTSWNQRLACTYLQGTGTVSTRTNKRYFTLNIIWPCSRPWPWPRPWPCGYWHCPRSSKWQQLLLIYVSFYWVLLSVLVTYFQR